jgi:prepilin-type N-terminal cleavage/methylation domain-containing protein
LFERLHNNHGVSLLEVMSAIIILSIAVVALYYMFNQGQVLLIEQSHRRLALEKAQQRMSIFKLLKDQRPTDIPYGTSSGTDFLIEPDDNDESPGLAADYELTVIDSTKYIFVKLEYNWTERSGRQYGFVMADCF